MSISLKPISVLRVFRARQEGEWIMNAIGKRIKAGREKKGWSVTEAAKAIGIPTSTYREWEYGRGVRADLVLVLSEALDVSVVELLRGEKPGKAEILQDLQEIERLLAAIKTKVLN
jgi:transcriptional regulator with XRE-family HTH domain